MYVSKKKSIERYNREIFSESLFSDEDTQMDNQEWSKGDSEIVIDDVYGRKVCLKQSYEIVDLQQIPPTLTLNLYAQTITSSVDITLLT